MMLNLKSPVLFTFLLMIVPFTDQYILKGTRLLYKKIYSSCRGGQLHGKWHLMLTNVSFSHHKSSVIKYVHNMYQVNALSDNIYTALAL